MKERREGKREKRVRGGSEVTRGRKGGRNAVNSAMDNTDSCNTSRFSGHKVTSSVHVPIVHVQTSLLHVQREEAG